MTSAPAHEPLGLSSALAAPLERFLASKRALGCRYREEARLLRHLDAFLAEHLDPADPVITHSIVVAFLARRGQESETTRAHRLTLLREVGAFLALEEPRTALPPPRYLGIARRTFVPRVLSREEGQRFLHACATLPPGRCSPLRGVVHGTVLALLYLAGLRRGEALRLTQADADLASGILWIRETKFGKSRLVPLAPDLTARLRRCRKAVTRHFGPPRPEAPFFPGPGGEPCRPAALRDAFHVVLRRAGIPYRVGTTRLRIHDLRHSFAALRLQLWYEQEADLSAKLPLLATYLGHVGLASSQRYLQLTPEMVGEITRRHEARFGYLITDWSPA